MSDPVLPMADASADPDALDTQDNQYVTFSVAGEMFAVPMGPVQEIIRVPEVAQLPLAPAVLEVVSPTEALLTVTEGRYHQVRRMFAAVGNHVETLHRERLGGLVLPEDLAPGAWRLLTPEEIASIFV